MLPLSDHPSKIKTIYSATPYGYRVPPWNAQSA